MDKETGFTDLFLDTSEWDGSDSVDRTNDKEIKNDDDSSDNESWSSYIIIYLRRILKRRRRVLVVKT